MIFILVIFIIIKLPAMSSKLSIWLNMTTQDLYTKGHLSNK